MDTTGVETNRRDNCQFVRDTMTIALDMIMKEQKTKEAEEYVKFRVSQLLQVIQPLSRHSLQSICIIHAVTMSSPRL